MRLPPSVRYLPSRLQVVLNPWLWLGILLTGIVGLYAWEYRQNPGQLPWQLGAAGLGTSSDSTATDALLESLTPEEQSVAAELDNVELLLAQLDSDISALTTGGDSSAAAALNASAAEAAGVSSESNVERLNRHINEYSFLGTGARGANVPGANVQKNKAQTITPVQRPSDSRLTLQPEAESGQPTSALADAFAQQQLALEVPESAETRVSRPNAYGAGTSGPDARGLPASESPSDESASDTSDSPTTFSFGQLDQSGVTPGGLEGLNRSFIRTTPGMSPPPGTTGYVPPASLSDFNRLNQQSGSNPFATQPSAGSFGTNTPSAGRDNTQVLPPTDIESAAPLETPAFDNSSQTNQNQPRNAWERFWN